MPVQILSRPYLFVFSASSPHTQWSNPILVNPSPLAPADCTAKDTKPLRVLQIPSWGEGGGGQPHLSMPTASLRPGYTHSAHEWQFFSIYNFDYLGCSFPPLSSPTSLLLLSGRHLRERKKLLGFLFLFLVPQFPALGDSPSSSSLDGFYALLPFSLSRPPKSENEKNKG